MGRLGAMPGPPTALTRYGLLSFLGQVLCTPVHLQQYVQLGRDSGQFRDQGIAQLPRSAPLLRTPSDRLNKNADEQRANDRGHERADRVKARLIPKRRSGRHAGPPSQPVADATHRMQSWWPIVAA